MALKVLTGLLNTSFVRANRSRFPPGIRENPERCPLAVRGYPFRAGLRAWPELPI